MTMTLLDLQGMESPSVQGTDAPTAGGSGLTILGCASQTPSNLSVALCH